MSKWNLGYLLIGEDWVKIDTSNQGHDIALSFLTQKIAVVHVIHII